jgi:MFS family permease
MGWPEPLVVAADSRASIGSSMLLIVFLQVESRRKEPLLSLSLFRDRRIALVCCNIFLTGIAIYGVSVYLPLFLQAALGASTTATGVIFALYVLATVAGSVIGGRLLFRMRWHRSLAVGGAGLTAIGLFLLSRMGGSTTQIEVLCNAVICGVGFGVLTPTYEVLVQNAAPAGTMGMATGMTQFFRAIGGAIALALFGTMLLRVYHAHMANVLPPDASAELRLDFDDPLKLVLTKPNLGAAVSGLANAGSALQGLLDGARVGLMSAMQSIFVACGAALAVSCVLNIFLGASPSPDEDTN